jgi:lipopolysaccharide export system ATP-binding protein
MSQAVEPVPVSSRSDPAGAGIATEKLVRYYARWRVVNEVSVHVHRGEVVGLLGPNGAGKTTTFYMITGLLQPNEGRVLLDGQDITEQPMYRRARMGLGYLSQEPSIFRRLTVRENAAVLETMKLTRQEREGATGSTAR